MNPVRRFTSLPAAFVSVLVLSSCSPLPGSGPSTSAIQSVSKEAEAPYTLINVTQQVADYLARAKDKPLSVAFGNTRRSGVSSIGVGDVVSVAIWEASENGLFSGAGRSSGGSNLPEQLVTESGTISVPYAGEIRVAGKTPQAVKVDIEAALQRMAVEPQVLVSVVKNNSNVVTVMGEVANSGRIALLPGGSRLVEIIAMAGGPRVEAHQLAVQISRGVKTETIPMEDLISDPRENIFVQPNDVITVIRQPRNFTVFGAAISNASVQFDESSLYLNQALAKVGGLDDNRANAKGIFVYRREPVGAIRSIVANAGPVQPDGMVNVIYQIDLRDPAGFFVLKSFKVQNRDLIYIANSSLAEVRKFSMLVNASVAPVVQGVTAANRLQALNGN